MIYIKLFISFLQIGLFSFGGGYASLPFIENEVIIKNNWLTMREFADIITISQATPGPIAINAATFVGIQIAGIPGAVTATMGCIFPSIVIVMFLSFLYYRYQELSIINRFLAGLRPAVIALIAAAGVSLISMTFINLNNDKLTKPMSNIDFISIVIFIAGFYLIRKYKISPTTIIFGSGVLGVVLNIML
jgi:chromate transporter